MNAVSELLVVFSLAVSSQRTSFHSSLGKSFLTSFSVVMVFISNIVRLIITVYLPLWVLPCPDF